MSSRSGAGARWIRRWLEVRKPALTGACFTVVVHILALCALAYGGAKRMHDTQSTMTVVSMSLMSARATRHDLGVPLATRSVTTTDTRKDGAENDKLAASVAQRRERVSLPPFDPYFLPEELTGHPQPVSEIVLDDECLRAGTTTLKLSISETGHVDRIDVVSSAAGEGCVERAKQAFGDATFAPGMREGVPVKSLWYVEIWHPDPQT